MLFSSATFLFYFLPCLIACYFIAPARSKNVLLLVGSLFFYAWGEGFYVALMVASITLNYIFGRLIDEKEKHNHLFITLGVTANLLILISYKYANFFIGNLNSWLVFVDTSTIDIEPIHLPLGISFFTFQAISYLIDIYRKEISSQKNILNLGLYISLFPQLIAGPIVRYKTISGQINKRHVTLEMFSQGAERFVYGLAKKMLIANPLGYVVDVIFELPASDIPTHVAWAGITLYALQIYFDFSGYSDMAIGLGRMFGFKFLENFNYPYIAQSLKEFWRRWHISLSSWFRDYLYIPLGGNKGSPARVYFNLFTVFLLCGLWHGASWNFLAWGAFHGSFLCIERLGFSQLLDKVWRPLRHTYLIFIVLLSWVMFRAETLTDAMDYYARMFSFDFSAIPFEFLNAMSAEVVIAFIAGLIFSCRSFLSNTDQNNEHQSIINPHYFSKLVMVILLFSLSITKLASSTYNPFIYFRF